MGIGRILGEPLGCGDKPDVRYALYVETCTWCGASGVRIYRETLPGGPFESFVRVRATELGPLDDLLQELTEAAVHVCCDLQKIRQEASEPF